MRYGNVELKYETGSLSITKQKSQIVRHYIGTDVSDCFLLGKQSTRIKCTLIVSNDSERILLEQLLHNVVERELHFDNHYYKRVVTAESFDPKPFVDGVGVIGAEFIALDPIPYDTVSGEALY
jgi:hypothetical protein